MFLKFSFSQVFASFLKIFFIIMFYPGTQYESNSARKAVRSECEIEPPRAAGFRPLLAGCSNMHRPSPSFRVYPGTGTGTVQLYPGNFLSQLLLSISTILLLYSPECQLGA